MRALNTAATGMAAQESNVNTISNNIANVNTVGFKKSRTEFDDLLYQTVKEAGARSSSTTNHTVGLQIGSGAKVSATKRDHAQGSSQITNNPYDLQILGQGFFGVIGGNGELRFTRNGSFTVDAQGNFMNKDGYRVFPGIVIPPNTKSLNISESGQVDAYFDNQVEPQNLGQIPVFTFVNPAGLRADGKTLYSATVGSGQAIQNIAGQSNSGAIMQGSLETSNVNVMNEMTNLIKAQRAYETNSKVMQSADQMLQTINSIR